MGKGKRKSLPETSRIELVRSVAYARKQKGPTDETQVEVAPFPDDGDAAPPVEDALAPRARTSTVAMAPHLPVGAPPAVPSDWGGATQIAISDAGVEDPTNMPGPREIPPGSPDDPAAPPGRVPPGDSRSLRRRTDTYQFALIYRQQTFVITRTGMVGTRGVWRVVEYPTSSSAAHAYAKECSRFVTDGFSDYRE